MSDKPTPSDKAWAIEALRTLPQRIQRKRVKGYNMQASSLALNGLECVSVTRPGKWGNVYNIRLEPVFGLWIVNGFNYYNKHYARGVAVGLHRRWCKQMIAADPDYFESLRGKNLSCFCKVGDACHGDNLIEFANREVKQ